MFLVGSAEAAATTRLHRSWRCSLGILSAVTKFKLNLILRLKLNLNL